MDFKKLRISNFKSFVDPVEININDGLTGVVGPNGWEIKSCRSVKMGYG